MTAYPDHPALRDKLDRQEKRMAARAKRATFHQRHDHILKTHTEAEFAGALANQRTLWDSFITFLKDQKPYADSYFSPTSNQLLEQVATWRRENAHPFLTNMSAAHVRWIVLVFSKKMHRLGRHMTAADCPPLAKFCQDISLCIEDDGTALVTIPKLGRIEVFIHPDSKKTWADARRRIVAASVSKEKRKNGDRWIVKLYFSKDKAPALNQTRQKGFIKKVTEETVNWIDEVVNFCKVPVKRFMERTRDTLGLSRATVYRVLATLRESQASCNHVSVFQTLSLESGV